jgi:hypothetical protein
VDDFDPVTAKTADPIRCFQNGIYGLCWNGASTNFFSNKLHFGFVIVSG